MTVFAIETKELTKSFNNELAIENLNLRVKEGAIYGLVGPNGSGKSTTIRIILGLTPATSGEVYIRQINREQSPLKCLQEIGAVMEHHGLYKDLTAQKNLEIVCLLHGLELNHVDRVLEFIGLESAKHKKVCQFSLGMKQRLAIGAALLPNPSLIILDEPTNGLDPVVTNELKSFIKKLPKLGVTVLITSHSLADIDELCDEIGVLNKGKLVYQGDKSSFKRNLRNNLIIKVDNEKAALSILSNAFNLEVNQSGGALIASDVDKSMVSKINKQLVENNIQIFELHVEKPTLEEAFMRNI